MSSPLSVGANPVPRAQERPWKAVVARYQRPANWRAIWQLLNTLVPYAALWYAMYRSLAISGWLLTPPPRR